MAYWMAYRNRKGNFKNYKCSECMRSAPQDSKKRSIVTDSCPNCGQQMSYIGLLEGVEAVRK